jgi:hypothetical protein
MIKLSFPIEMYGQPPFDGCTKLTGTRADGLPDGVHTGGAFLTPDGFVWKPLIARPYPNADALYPTKEIDLLREFADKPFFPKNWTEVMTPDGRPWLVRKLAPVYGQEIEHRRINRDVLLALEQAVRGVNRAGWEINDLITLALDPKSYKPFIVDLSTAYPTRPVKWCDDSDRFYRFAELCGYDRLSKLRHNAAGAWHHELMKAISEEDKDRATQVRRARHVYASYNRPFSLMWATMPFGTLCVHTDRSDPVNAVPHTWVFTVDPLPPNDDRDSEAYRYELTWAYSPLHEREHDQ